MPPSPGAGLAPTARRSKGKAINRLAGRNKWLLTGPLKPFIAKSDKLVAATRAAPADTMEGNGGPFVTRLGVRGGTGGAERESGERARSAVRDERGDLASLRRVTTYEQVLSRVVATHTTSPP